jgi:hypothetical protein
MLPDYAQITNQQLRSAALALSDELDPLLNRVQEDQNRFAEVKKLYDEKYRQAAVDIAALANKRGSGADVSVILADIQNPTHLRAVKTILLKIIDLPDEARSTNA